MIDIASNDPSDLLNEFDYNLKSRHPERTLLYEDYARRSEVLRNKVEWQCFQYDVPERCSIDWFPAEKPDNAPLLIFIHGGYWRGGDKRVFSFLIEGFRQQGVSTALVGYELAPAVTVTTIGQQVRRAIRYLLSQQKQLRFDTSRITLSGHSAGAHLAAMASAYPEEIGVKAECLSVVGLSGVYDLAPVMQCSLRQEIGLTAEVAADQSLPNGRSLAAREYLIFAGERETPAFIKQSQTFHQTLVKHGIDSKFEIVPACTHFDIFEPLADCENHVHQLVLAAVLRR